MRLELAVSLAAAVMLHALLLFGFKLGTEAHPLKMSENPSTVDVSLVEAPPEPAPPEPAPTPEPQPQPTPEMSTPPPEPLPTPVQETMPAPEATPAIQAPTPHPPAPQHTKPAVPHSVAASSAAPAIRGPASGVPGVHAKYRSNPRPDYPEEARKEHQQGVVLLSVNVSADGRASEVTLKRSCGFPALDQAAIQAVRRWTFDPAREAGLPVSSRVDVPVRFSLAN